MTQCIGVGELAMVCAGMSPHCEFAMVRKSISRTAIASGPIVRLDWRMITIAYATETGIAANLADETQEKLTEFLFRSEVIDLGELKVPKLKHKTVILAFVSTWGGGDPPSSVWDFYEELSEKEPIGLAGMEYAIFSLGDSTYEHFCQFGKDLDAQLERHGARRLLSRVDCDVDFKDDYEEWVFQIVCTLIGSSIEDYKESSDLEELV